MAPSWPITFISHLSMTGEVLADMLREMGDTCTHCIEALSSTITTVRTYYDQAANSVRDLAGMYIIGPTSVIFFGVIVEVSRLKWEAMISFQPPPGVSAVSGFYGPGTYDSWIFNAVAVVCESDSNPTSDQIWSYRLVSTLGVVVYAAIAGIDQLHMVAHPESYSQAKIDASDRVCMIGWIFGTHYLLRRLIRKLASLSITTTAAESASPGTNHSEDPASTSPLLPADNDGHLQNSHRVDSPMLDAQHAPAAPDSWMHSLATTSSLWKPSLQTAVWILLWIHLTIAMFAYNIQHGNLGARLGFCGTPLFLFLIMPLLIIYYYGWAYLATLTVNIGTLVISTVYVLTPPRYRYDPDSPTAPRSGSNLSDKDQVAALIAGCLFIVPHVLLLWERGRRFRANPILEVTKVWYRFRACFGKKYEPLGPHAGAHFGGVDTVYHGAGGEDNVHPLLSL